MFHLQHLKMFVLAIVVFVLFSIAESVQSESSTNIVPRNASVSCEPYETQCALGCCPYADAVCCADGYECCQHGQTCIPIIGICIGALNNNGKISLVSERSTQIRRTFLTCSTGMTECAPDRCCPHKQAVCCADGVHCCPNGYRCDVSHQQCVRQTPTKETGKKFLPLRRMSKKATYKSCPGGRQICPAYMSCCLKDNGEWGCCPNPSVPEIRYKDSTCCNAWFGFICCGSPLVTCTIFGCL